MRLLFLTQTYPRFDGDTSGPFIRDLARHLVAGGDRVTVLTPHAEAVERAWNDDGVAVRSFRYAPERFEAIGYSRSLDADETMKRAALAVAPAYFFGALRAALAELRRARRRGRPYDLLQAHWVVPNGLVAAALPRFATGGVRIAVGLHGSDVFLAEKPGFRQTVGTALRRVGVLTGCSPELVDRVCALGFDRDRSRVIPYGVDGALFRPAGSEAEKVRAAAWRQRLGVPSEAPLLLSVGRMATKKGYQVLLERLEVLMRRAPEAHLVFAGAGDRLEEFRAKASPWSARVHFPGAVLRDTLPDLYRAADVFFLPAVHDPKGNVDGLPNVLLEGMASGLPVVATAISGIPLAIEDREHGRLVVEGDADAFVDALLDVLSDAERARAMGRRGRLRTESELSWPAVASRYRQAYELALTAP
ncbi:MAG: glycosyltransferase [Acidobacteriota bacterium]